MQHNPAERGRGNETEYRFANLEGLVLCVLAGGRKTWKFHYSVMRDGRQQKRKVRLGVFPVTPLVEARRAAFELSERVEHEGDVVAVDRSMKVKAERNGLTFADLLDEYVQERQGLASIRETERELRKDAIPALGSKRPADITAADIDTIARAIVERGSPAMARRQIMLIKALYNFALLDRPSIAD
jgi:hypothetical protein